MIANIISNPNIRFLILCGSEVQGHITGQSIESLHKYGLDPEKGKIEGAKGAIPYIENITTEAIQRFQKQLEIVSLIDVEDSNQIRSKVKECIEKDPGAAEEQTLIIDLDDDENLGKIITI
jgi:tetrahydromethanopterin S-methyltransferase subunit A